MEGGCFSFAAPGLIHAPNSVPTACALGCILSPLRGWSLLSATALYTADLQGFASAHLLLRP